MNTTFKVMFKYEGTEPAGIIRDAIQAGYVGIYNIFCEIVNPMFETWNAQYDGPNDGFDEEDRINPESEYNTYIRQKQTELVDKYINPTVSQGDIFKRFFIGDECDLRAELKDGTTMQMYLTQE